MRMVGPAVLLSLGLAWAGPAFATEITQEGLSFSDEGGGFTLKSVTGRGSQSSGIGRPSP